jgi:glucose/mannose-6-phosphate isomerase
MVDLDDHSAYRRFDKSGMLDHLHRFPQECHRAWEQVLTFEVPREYRRISNVIILGMGGSAIGGDIVRRLALSESRLPVFVHRDYSLPAFADETSLIIASSYSGNTEETLSAFSEALRTPSRKLVITSGGRLKRIADNEGIPAFLVDYRAPPRAALAHSLIPMIGIFQQLGLLGDRSSDMQETLDTLRRLSEDYVDTKPLASNPAKQMATRLHGSIIVTYGADMLTEVAQRWKAQFNENSKNWAFSESFPELNHNAIVGYSCPPKEKQRMFVVMLRSRALGQRNLLRYEATADLLTKAEIAHDFIDATGDSPLAQIMSLVYLGDYVSFYLALISEVDPTPVDAIDYIKSFLARSAVAGD